MSNVGLRPGEQYYAVQSCPMKCRIFPNETQKRMISSYIHGAQSFCNMALYDILNEFRYTNEKKDKKTGAIVHFVDWQKVGEKDILNEYRVRNEYVKMIPGSALSSSVFGCIADLKKGAAGKPVEKFKYQKKNKNGKLKNHQSPAYYTKQNPRTSYTVKETLGKLTPSENKNIFYFNFCKLGDIKVRGWNKNNRYLIDGEYVDFVEFAKRRKDVGVITTVSVDNCGDYWASFTICCNEKSKYDTHTYKRCQMKPADVVGVDVGQDSLATLSSGEKIPNPEYAKTTKKKTSEYNRQLSNAWGWSNPEFREARKRDKTLQPSNNYNKLKTRNAKLNRDIAQKRELYQHEQSRKIVEDHAMIAVESLTVSDLMDKEKNFEKYGTRKKAANHSRGLSDAAMSKFLDMLKYKAAWYDRETKEIGKYERSTGVCAHCGYTTPEKLDTNIREWDCPSCGTHHDRDISAAIVILKKALEKSN